MSGHYETLRHEFVGIMPEQGHLEDGVVYVSIPLRLAMHKCCCGCGTEVSTPLGPTFWELRFDGVTVSLFPSIGNRQMTCKSHYWITRNRVYWAIPYSQVGLEKGLNRLLQGLRQRIGKFVGREV